MSREVAPYVSELVLNRQKFDLERPSNAQRDELAASTTAAFEKLIAAQRDETREFSAQRQVPQVVKYKLPGTDEELSVTVVAKPVDPLLHAKRGLRRADPLSHHKSANTEVPAPEMVSVETRPVVNRVVETLSKEEKAQWRIPGVVSNWKNNQGRLVALEERAKAFPERVEPISHKHMDLAAALADAEQEVSAEYQESAQQELRRKLLAQKRTQGRSFDDDHETVVAPRRKARRRDTAAPLIEFEPERK